MTDQPDLDPAAVGTDNDTLPPSEATDEPLDEGPAVQQPEAVNAPWDHAVGGGRHRRQVSGSPEDDDSFFTLGR